MRGFTILTVVYVHVWNFCFGNDFGKISPPFLFIDLIQQFFMPLFFFISGLVLYSTKRTWSLTEIVQFFKKKIPVQLLFPAACMVVCMLMTHRHGIVECIYDHSWCGYWFTFVLLEFFVVYIVLQLLLRPIRHHWSADVIQLVVAFVIYLVVIYLFRHHNQELMQGTLLSLFSVEKFGFFMYFVIGTLVRKHFVKFERVLDSNVFILLCFVVLLSLNMIHSRIPFSALAVGFTSVMIVFIFFRRYQQSFMSNRRLGSVMQYVGRRTLDIYLLHYFFIFTNDLTTLNTIIKGSPVLGFCCSLVFAIVVICLCLLVSNVLRISPFISKYCFGVK